MDADKRRLKQDTQDLQDKKKSVPIGVHPLFYLFSYPRSSVKICGFKNKKGR
jgi:hypothetical protein